MKKKEVNYIKQLEIKGLWGLFNVNLKLNPDVNIIVGENGTGKSTILMILKMIAGLSVDSIKQKSFQANTITTTWVTELVEQKFRAKEKNIMIKGLISSFSWESELPENILVNYIATFDSKPNHQIDFDDRQSVFIETDLDKELNQRTLLYTQYQNRLLKKSENRGKSLNEILKKRDWLFDTLNELFKPTNKRFVESEEDSRPSILLSNGEKLSLFQLSSGEKQLLIILFTVLCQDEKPSILLLDEPEISLHTRWQHELIEIIRTLNPNCQVIAMTHSPSIFNDGWRDKVIWMADVLEDIKPVLEPVNTEGV
jgi:ABC-type lipoprotein export system ATPase subunit